MTKLNISLDNLDDVLSRLWEVCEDEGAYFKANPSKKTIEVFKKDDSRPNDLITEIKVVTLTESYDLKEEIFNK